MANVIVYALLFPFLIGVGLSIVFNLGKSIWDQKVNQNNKKEVA